MKLEDNLNVTVVRDDPTYVGQRIVVFYNVELYDPNCRYSFRHHTNGPSFIRSTGYMQYRIDGDLHNEKGPSIYSGLSLRYYLNGHSMSKESWLVAVRKKNEA